MKKLLLVFFTVLILFIVIACQDKVDVEIKPNIHNVIAVTERNLYAVTNKGEVIVSGDNSFSQHSVKEWQNIVGVVANEYSVIGLKENGTLVVIGDDFGVKGWSGIKRLEIGDLHVVGLDIDNKLRAAGTLGRFHFESSDTRKFEDASQDYVNTWGDIVDYSVGFAHTVAIDNNGNFKSFGYNLDGQLNLESLGEVTMLKAGFYHTLGLKKDKTVVGVGAGYDNELDVNHWRDIVYIAASERGSFGVTSDGRVKATGSNLFGELDVESWQDCIAIYTSKFFTVGLRNDGTIYLSGNNPDQEIEIDIFRDIITVFK